MSSHDDRAHRHGNGNRPRAAAEHSPARVPERVRRVQGLRFSGAAGRHQARHVDRGRERRLAVDRSARGE
ncbi:MAG TPA: hypothetical protein VIC62_18615 [Nakamurella sp.]